MKVSAFFILFWLLLAIPGLYALEMVSVAPRKASPGEIVQVKGGPFSPDIMVFVGTNPVPPLSVEENEIRFTVPRLDEGEYLLFLRSQEEESQPFHLEIESSPPLVQALSPIEMDECGLDSQGPLEVKGENFQPGAIVLLDGKVVPSVREGTRLISLPSQALKGGVHELQVVNPDGRQSLPQGLLVNDQPEIFSVYQGEDRVNSYELIVQGKNFFQNSQLLVDGRVILPVSGIPAQTEIVRYLNCNTLVYERYPYSRELKQISLRITNPNGKQSTPFVVTTP